MMTRMTVDKVTCSSSSSLNLRHHLHIGIIGVSLTQQSLPLRCCCWARGGSSCSTSLLTTVFIKPFNPIYVTSNMCISRVEEYICLIAKTYRKGNQCSDNSRRFFVCVLGT